ncbi:MAG: PDZ domain-containing protein [Verrucomicrobiaceae bacterium]|nr:MAG: PDZ domain-containing protein [Verrucomicrobiaceae bacterium]
MFPPAVFKLSTTALALMLGGILAGSALAQDSLAENLSGQVRKIFDEHRDAVVKVRAKDKLGIRFGSGFFADLTGTVYTHAGIVLKADEVTVISNGKELPARVLVADERSGIAILKVDASTPSIPIGDSQKVMVATPVMMIGYPEDLDASPSFGIVGGLDREYLGQHFSTTHIRANLPVQRGQGGAPVLNFDGEAIGILVGRVDAGSACHVLPMRAAEKVRSDLARFGELRPGWVGVEVEESETPVQGSTAKVGALDPDTPAAVSGLQLGDILLKVGGMPIISSEDVIDASYFLTAGDNADIEIVRGSENMTISVRPVLHPLAPGHEMQATVKPDVSPRLHLE